MVGPSRVVGRALAVRQEVCQHLGAEFQRVDGYPFIDPVEQRREIQIRRQPQRREAEAANTQARERFRVCSAGKHVRHSPRVGIDGQQRRVHRIDELTVERGLVRRQGGDPLAGDIGPDQLVDLGLERRQPPGSTRQSTTASAVAGTTLAL